MSDVGLLFDEHVGRSLRDQLRRQAPQLRLYAVGDGSAPPTGTLDPGLLVWLEEHNCLLVTNNRSSMPPHLRAHLAVGRHIPGIIQLPRRPQFGQVLVDLELIATGHSPGEFGDQITYLPL
jgi:hypothetical protein